MSNTGHETNKQKRREGFHSGCHFSANTDICCSEQKFAQIDRSKVEFLQDAGRLGGTKGGMWAVLIRRKERNRNVVPCYCSLCYPARAEYSLAFYYCLYLHTGFLFSENCSWLLFQICITSQGKKHQTTSKNSDC